MFPAGVIHTCVLSHTPPRRPLELEPVRHGPIRWGYRTVFNTLDW
jgi:hypothetical protein